MFNALTTEQKQEVKALVQAIGETNVQALRQYTAQMFPDSTSLTHLEFVHNCVAMIIADRQDTAQDYIDENLIPTLVQVLTHFCDWCNKYITNGDRIPDDRISDIFAIASTAHHDYWHEPIANILSYIPALVKETQGGKNVSTALFDVIINTAFDYDMQG